MLTLQCLFGVMVLQKRLYILVDFPSFLRSIGVGTRFDGQHMTDSVTQSVLVFVIETDRLIVEMVPQQHGHQRVHGHCIFQCDPIERAHCEIDVGAFTVSIDQCSFDDHVIAVGRNQIAIGDEGVDKSNIFG